MSRHPHLPNYACEAAQEDARSAAKRLLAVLQGEFPLGTRVRVHHYKGCYAGIVIGHQELDNCGYLVIRNDASGKSTRRHFGDIGEAP